MQAPASTRPAGDRPAPELVGAAFRDLHADRLHGFALLLTLGDRPFVAALVGDALAAGSARADELRHPERAAAWLRERVLRVARSRHTSEASTALDRRHALDLLAVELPVQASLATLTLRERAVIIADAVERLDRRDIASIVGLDGAGLARLVERARRRYMAAYDSASGSDPLPDGPIVRRVRDAARRAMG